MFHKLFLFLALNALLALQAHAQFATIDAHRAPSPAEVSPRPEATGADQQTAEASDVSGNVNSMSTNSSSLKTSIVEPTKIEKPFKAYTFDFLAELSTTESRLERRDRGLVSGVDELSLGLTYRFNPEFQSQLELSTVRVHDEQRFTVKKAYVEYEFASHILGARLGQDLLPIGFLNEDEYRYQHNPAFYAMLMPSEKFSDLGARLQIMPFATRAMFVEGAVYTGESERLGDGRRGPAELRPRVISVKSESKYHQAFLTYVRHDLAFSDETVAYGAGVKLSTDQVLKYDLELQSIGEIWAITGVQTQGPNQDSTGAYIDPSLRFKFLTLGARFERTTSRLKTLDQSLTPLLGVVYHLSFDYGPFVRLQLEKIKQVQNDIVLDEAVARLLFRYSL